MFDLFFKAVCGGYDKNFSYIIGDPKEKTLGLIDASISLENLQSSLDLAYKKGYTNISKIFLTHSHHDHIAYLAEIQAKTQAQVYAHQAAENRIQKIIDLKINYIHHEQILNLGSEQIRAIHTPGHQPDCICFIWRNKIFTGDTLFVEGCGRCNFPESSPEDQFESLHFIANQLDPNLEVYPGHNYGSVGHSTIAREKEVNKYLKTKDKNIWLALRAGNGKLEV